MGKKLGNALIIYGVLNFVASWFVPLGPGVIAGAFIWMIIMILVGNWQRGKARAEASRDKQTQLLEEMKSQQEQQQKRTDVINRILDDHQQQQRRTREFNN